MDTEQEIFLKELGQIQDYCVNVSLCKKNDYCDTKELLLDVTSEVIFRIMELIDGYGHGLSKCELISSKT